MRGIKQQGGTEWEREKKAEELSEKIKDTY